MVYGSVISRMLVCVFWGRGAIGGFSFGLAALVFFGLLIILDFNGYHVA